VVSNSIEGPWSDPVELNVEGIEPGHVVEENGKRYLYFNRGGNEPVNYFDNFVLFFDCKDISIPYYSNINQLVK
jgi:beta-xylosidase